jgi:hypothetical protein
MNINDFIGEKADKKMRIVRSQFQTFELDPTETEFVTFENFWWMLQYIEFLEGNRRANQNGLD